MFVLDAGSNLIRQVNLFASDLPGSYVAGTREFDPTDPPNADLFNDHGADAFTFYSLMKWSVLVTGGNLTLDIAIALIPGPDGGIVDALLDIRFEESTSTTPLPGALPLFASGMGVLGMLTWRRRRRAQA